MPEVAKCPDCDPSVRTGPLIGGKCHYHWKNPKAKVERNADPKLKLEEKAAKKTLAQWFKEQLAQAPKNCENCGKPIVIPAGINPRTKVAHIVPKSTVKSVRTHELNRWFACWQCAHDFDNKSPEEVAKMKVAKVCKERYQQFKNLIPPIELKRVQDWLKK